MKSNIIFDVECYTNYFLLSFLQIETGKIRHFEMYDGQPLDVKSIASILKNNTTISFNGNHFDIPIIVQAIKTGDCAKVKMLCNAIIESKLPAWRVIKDFGLTIPNIDHIDLIEVAIGMSSLKIYGGRLHCHTIQDLPIAPSALIAPEQRKELRSYCENDLHTTELLYKHLLPQIKLRQVMSEQYGMDLRSKSDAQIAGTVIKSEVSAITGKEYRAPQVPDNYEFYYNDPKIVSFQTEQLQQVFDKLLITPFALGGNGAVVAPDWIKEQRITIGNTSYQMGIGGLHSCENAQFIKADDTHLLIEYDFASFYPNIILQQQLSPKSMGAAFLNVYRRLVERRLIAKATGDKVTADVLKISVNASFGHLGSKYSPLFAPDLLVQVTMTGQLILLMLIESLEAVGASVVSANTDGVVVYCDKNTERAVEEVVWECMLTTSIELERADYSAIASRDVNNYLAVKLDGKTKGKGCFAAGGLAKNPDCNIVYTAVTAFLARGTPIAETIRNCKDVRQFVMLRKVTGGAIFREELLGKAARFYHSNEVSQTENIQYVKNGNKVPKSAGCRPLMTLPDSMPSDVFYDIYIASANELLKEVGYVRA